MLILSITKTQKNVECQVLVVQQEQEDLAAVDEDSEKKKSYLCGRAWLDFFPST